MKAMVLAAGLGTRLRPLTDTRPKALAEIDGRTLLEIALRRLREFGVEDVIVNVHHFAPMVADYLQAHHNFGIKIELSWEDELLLDTGGGLKKAADFFLRDGGSEPFFLHNVDVLSDIDLAAMLHCHCKRNALATLAVRQRPSRRQLLFDDQSQLCGRRNYDADAEATRAALHVEELAFAGIHVISPRIFELLSEDGAFPIIPAYLRLAGQGETIAGFRCDQSYWRDLGTLESLRQAETDMAQGLA